MNDGIMPREFLKIALYFFSARFEAFKFRVHTILSLPLSLSLFAIKVKNSVKNEMSRSVNTKIERLDCISSANLKCSRVY
jgi:hypothetical protein